MDWTVGAILAALAGKDRSQRVRILVLAPDGASRDIIDDFQLYLPNDSDATLDEFLGLGTGAAGPSPSAATTT
jgi:hypothetical protein